MERRLTPDEREAIDYIREWARAGFPRRVDGSFPPDFITAMRRLTDVPPEKVDYRTFEDALCAGPDFDHVMPRHKQWSSRDAVDMQRRFA